MQLIFLLICNNYIDVRLLWNSFFNYGQLSLMICLAPRAAKMNKILRCDWLPERARRSHLALPAPDYPLCPAKNFPDSHIINPFFTKFARERWLDIGLVIFLRVYGP